MPEGFCFAAFLPQADTHTRNNKINKGKQHRKNTNGNVQCETTWKKGAKKQRSRILQAHENKYIIHLKMAM
jgi:hypothetical protein